MEWSDVLTAAGVPAYSDHNDGLEFHHLSMSDVLPLTRAVQKNQKHMDTYLPLFSKGDPKSLLSVQKWVMGMLKEQFPSQHFVFTYKGKLCGLASTLPISDDPTEIQFRYLVFEGFTGKGLGTRIAYTLEIYAFTIWGFNRIFIEMDSSNRASMGIAQKLGYRLVGTMDHDINGTKETGFWYSFVKERPAQTSP